MLAAPEDPDPQHAAAASSVRPISSSARRIAGAIGLADAVSGHHSAHGRWRSMAAESRGILRLNMVTDANAAGGVPVPDGAPPCRSASIGAMSVRRATQADVDPMAAQLCRAFFDDPVIGHVFRNEARRTEGMRRYFTTQMRGDYFPYGGCYTTDDYKGAAIWGPRRASRCSRGWPASPTWSPCCPTWPPTSRPPCKC